MRTRRSTNLHLSLLLTLGVSLPLGCDIQGQASKSATDAPKNKAKAPMGKAPMGKAPKGKAPNGNDPATLFAKGSPEMPGPLAKLKWGMTKDQVKKAAPELGGGYAKAKKYKDTYFGYYIPDDSGKLYSVRVVVQAGGADLEKILTAAWGKPKKGQELGKPKLFWFNEAKKIRATIRQGFGKDKEVQFEPYLPAKELLGAGKDKLGFEVAGKPLLGSSYDDLKANYGPWLAVLTKEEAAKQGKQIAKLTGKNLAALGGSVTSTNIDLPPTEFGGSFTRVHPVFKDEKIIRFTVGIEWGAFPAAKGEILGLLKAKWGEPKQETKSGNKQLVFGASQTVVVEEDDISKKWDIEVEVAK